MTLAKNADGTLADVPHDTAREISHELFDVLTLVHVIQQVMPGSDANDYRDDLTDASSRATALAAMASDKVKSLLKMLSPYV